MKNQEKRFLSGEVEVRSAEDSQKTVVEGYAALFDTETVIGGQFAERVARGAFDKADMSNTVALFNHNWDQPLARMGNGLTLEVDERGLKYRFELGNQSYAQDLAENIRMGNVSTSSFGFTIRDDEWERRDGMNLRTINEVDVLYDVSPTTQGAYPTTEVGLRSMEAALGDLKAEEEAEDEQVEEVVNEVEELAEEAPEAVLETVLETPDGVGADILGKNAVIAQEQINNGAVRTEQTAMNTKNNAPAVVQSLGDNESRASQKFSFGKMVKEAAQGRLTGLEAEMNQEARNEFNNAKVNVSGGISIPSFIVSRAALGVNTVSTGDANSTAFGGTIGTADLGIIEDFVPNDLAAQMGVRNLGDLTGDVVFQVENAQPSVGTPTEGSTQGVNNGGFTSVSMSPKRYAAHTQVTDQMLAQSADDMGSFLAAQIRKAMDAKFNVDVIGAIDGAYSATAYNAITANPLDIEAQLLAADVDLADVVALCGTTAYRAFRALSHDAGSGSMFSMDPQSRRNVMGYNAYIASQVTVGDAHFFDKNQLVTGTWGGLNLIIDPYTDADKGVTRIIANSYRDVKALNTAGFKGLSGVTAPTA
jgi:HK97 family phage prohead protease